MIISRGIYDKIPKLIFTAENIPVIDEKSYLTGALSTGLNLGKGSGSLNHGFNLRGVDFVGGD